jgi:hypothetical protein
MRVRLHDYTPPVLQPYLVSLPAVSFSGTFCWIQSPTERSENLEFDESTIRSYKPMLVLHSYLTVAIYVLRTKCERRDPGRSGGRHAWGKTSERAPQSPFSKDWRYFRVSHIGWFDSSNQRRSISVVSYFIVP